MFKLMPAFKDYLWGGTKLKTEYGKESNLDIVAETWELSTHPDGLSIIDSGEYKGQTLLSYVEKNRKSVLGSKCSLENDIPILIKFIDAKDALSIQVHPDNEYALKNENDFGKTEMWYIIEAEPDAKLIYGFNKDISKEEFEKAIKENTLTEVVNEINVKKGDVLFIKPGTLHAIGKGIVIAEIQQRSNVTYRIYDFGRLGADGKPRELHIEKALDVTNLKKQENLTIDYKFTDCETSKKALLAECSYFHVELIKLNDKLTFETNGETFHSLLILDGTCNIVSEKNLGYSINGKKGDSIFIPANTGKYEIVGNADIILTTL
ncbi:MAG: class I mannose-6-phosphate isomerase [Eubacteriales bacterium]|nr:class I mannose-6-phosphate isomerase [Eubacteriales bacterium]